MKFAIRHYPNATCDDDFWTLGEPGELVKTVEVAYPAQLVSHLPRLAAYLGVWEEENVGYAWRRADGRVLGTSLVSE